MGTTGTVVNGRIELDDPGFFPEGTKVEVGTWDIVAHSPHRPYVLENELAILRQSVEDAKAGLGISREEAMARVDAELEVFRLGAIAK